MTTRVLIVATIGAVLVGFPQNDARSEVRLLAAVGVREIITELAPQFENRTRNKLLSTFDASGRIVQRILSGETFDVVIINKPMLEKFAKSEKVRVSAETDIASSVVAAAVRKGIPRPDISTVEKFKQALLDARSVARPSIKVGGASGDHITWVMQRLGIEGEVNAKSVFSERPDDRSNMPGVLVATGQAELALHQLQELMAVPGLEILGEFPGELRGAFVFTAVIVTQSARETTAKSLLDFLRTPESKSAIKGKGMVPAN